MHKPVFKIPRLKMSSCQGFQKGDIVEMLTKKGKVIGCLNCFDKTASGKTQKLRVKTGYTGDNRKSGNITQLRTIQKRDGYGYEIEPANREFSVPKRVSDTIPIKVANPVQLTMF